MQLTLYLPPQVCTCTTIHYIYYLNLHLMCHTETIIWFSHLYFDSLCWEWAELYLDGSWMSWGFGIYRMNFREFYHFHRLFWRKTRYLRSKTVVSAVRWLVEFKTSDLSTNISARGGIGNYHYPDRCRYRVIRK